MAILNVVTDFVGQIGVTPRIVKIQCDDSFATITTANYLNEAIAMGYKFLPTDMAEVTYAGNDTGFFKVNISGSTITLVPQGDGVILPVVDGNFVNFAGTDGTLDDKGFSPTDATKTKVVMASAAVIANHIACFSDTAGTVNDDSATAMNGGNLQAGLSGTAGYLASFPATAATGSLRMAGVSNTGDTVTTISNAEMGQASVISIPDPAAATANFAVAPSPLVNGNFPVASGEDGLLVDGGIPGARVLYTSFGTPDVNINLVRFDIAVTAAALAAGASVELQASTDSKQYKVINLWVNSSGTNFSGGGGDRLLTITDNTTDYSVVPAASLQTLVNTAWGVTELPFPASAALNTSTAAGAALVAKYSGGTTDYGAGSVVISGLLQRVA